MANFGFLMLKTFNWTQEKKWLKSSKRRGGGEAFWNKYHKKAKKKFWMDSLREDFEVPNVDFLRNFSLRSRFSSHCQSDIYIPTNSVCPLPPYFRELRTFWDTFDFGHKKGEKPNFPKHPKWPNIVDFLWIGYFHLKIHNFETQK